MWGGGGGGGGLWPNIVCWLIKFSKKGQVDKFALIKKQIIPPNTIIRFIT